MPPAAGRGGRILRGMSAIIASAVIRSAAIEPASSRAVANNLGGIDNAGLDHVDIGFGLGVEALIAILAVGELADDDRAFDAGVLGDLPDRRLERPAAQSKCRRSHRR